MDRLQEIWNLQYSLDEETFKNASTDRKSTLTSRQVALLTEVGELYNEMQNFKYWKHNKDIQTDKVKEEFADVLHFVMSLAIDVFEDADDMYEWYKYKHNENIRRQNNNY